jgi:replicative DNA helicase
VNRPVPMALDAEQTVVGALMIDRELVANVSAIAISTDFSVGNHRRVFDAIMSLYFDDAPTDVVAVAEELRRRDQLEAVGGPQFLTSLCNTVPTTASVEYYAHEVVRASRARQLIHAGQAIMDLGFEAAQEIDDQLERAEQVLYALRGRGLPMAVQMAPAIKTWLADLEKKHRTPALVLPYPTLHYHIGGLQPGWVYVLAGRPNHCKTMMALDIALSISRLHPVVFGSLEEGVNPIVARAVGRDAGIPISRLLTGQANEYDFAKSIEAAGDLSERKLTFLGRPLFLRELRGVLRREKAERGLSLLIIDHSRKLKDMRVDVRKNTTYVVEDVLDELKELAEELEIPVLLLVHLGREADRAGADGPRADHVGDSDHYERAAAALMAVWLPARYDAKEPKNKLMLRVLKAKYGPQGDIPFAVDLAFNRIREATPMAPLPLEVGA